MAFGVKKWPDLKKNVNQCLSDQENMMDVVKCLNLNRGASVVS